MMSEASRWAAEEAFVRFADQFTEKWGTGPVEHERVKELWIATLDTAIARAVAELETQLEMARAEAYRARTESVQAVEGERAEIAHRIRLIFKDAASFYEVNECLALANELKGA